MRDQSRDEPREPQLGDTLDHGRAGKVDPDVGSTQAGTPSHERSSFNDPITASEADGGTSRDRVPGAFSDTPDFVEPRAGESATDQGGFGAHSTGHMRSDNASPMRGAGTPVRRVHGDGLPGETPDSSGRSPEHDMHKPVAHMGQQAQSLHRGETMDRNERERLDAANASGKGPKTNDIIHHDDHPGVGDHVGEAAGGISGVLTGAAIGSAGGPIGTIIGGIAGAIGGWWSGRAISEAATRFTHSDDEFYRSHYEAHPNRMADRKYEDVRPAYQIGHLASHNPDYENREWSEVERDLQRGWTDDLRTKHGEWNAVSPYARDAWMRGRTTRTSTGLGASAGAAAASPANTAGYGTTSNLGATGTGRTDLDDRAGDKAENLWDRTKQGADNLGHKIADKADDVKDRVDGNPGSRPGPDSTDRRF